MYVMKTSPNKNTSILFNLVTLLGFVLTLFLIIFLKRRESKNTVQPLREDKEERGRVKTLTLDAPQLDKEGLNDRQSRILDRIKQEGRMDPKEIYDLVPNVSTRTIRRDMDILIKKGFVSQEGTTKSTTYIYIG
jgi:predicted HTH transcriptional regulator